MKLCNGIQLILSFVFFIGSLNIYGQSAQKKIAVINVIGMTYKDAKDILQKRSSGVGAVIPSGESENLDSLIVYRQNPPSKNEKGIQNFIRKGSYIDLFLIEQRTIIDTLEKPVQKKLYRAVSHKQKL